MSTLSFITNLIDTKIRNKTPKVLKTEHADVEQGIANLSFPTPVKVEWNGTSSVSPTTDIVVESGIASGIMQFEVNFWKSGNTETVIGKIKNLQTTTPLPDGTKIIDFATALHEPLASSKLFTELNRDGALVVTGTKISISADGIKLFGVLNPSSEWYYFNTTYKVAN